MCDLIQDSEDRKSPSTSSLFLYLVLMAISVEKAASQK